MMTTLHFPSLLCYYFFVAADQQETATSFVGCTSWVSRNNLTCQIQRHQNAAQAISLISSSLAQLAFSRQCTVYSSAQDRDKIISIYRYRTHISVPYCSVYHAAHTRVQGYELEGVKYFTESHK